MPSMFLKRSKTMVCAIFDMSRAICLGFLSSFSHWHRNVAMGTTRAQGPTVTHLHNLQQIPAGTRVKILMLLNTTSAGWLLASDLLGKFGNFVVVKLLDASGVDGSSEGTGAFSCWRCAIPMASRGTNHTVFEIHGVTSIFLSRNPLQCSAAASLSIATCTAGGSDFIRLT